MYNGMMGDLRGVVVIVGGVGLLGIGLLRAASFLPRPWRVYTDRIEFTFVAMLWIVWTCEYRCIAVWEAVAAVCLRAVPTSPVSLAVGTGDNGGNTPIQPRLAKHRKPCSHYGLQLARQTG